MAFITYENAMQELLTEIPDVEVLLGLEPEELAAKALFLLRRLLLPTPN